MLDELHVLLLFELVKLLSFFQFSGLELIAVFLDIFHLVGKESFESDYFVLYCPGRLQSLNDVHLVNALDL